MPRRLSSAFGTGVTRLLSPAMRMTSRRAGVAVAFHRVDMWEGDPSRELVPPRDRGRFRQQMRYLRRHFALVPAATFPEAVATRRRGQRFPVCLTFDDDLAAHVEHALPILREEGVPATFFLCGASLEDPRSFWWERLQRALDGGATYADVALALPGSQRPGPDEMDLQGLAQSFRLLSPADRDHAENELLKLAGPDPPEAGMRAGAVAELAEAGYAIGFHTRRHDDLAQLDERQLEQAFVDGRHDLERVSGQPIDLLAYPHGSADRRVAAGAERAGFKLAFTGSRCATTPESERWLLGRLSADDKPTVGKLALALVGTLLIGPSCDGAEN